jgi:GTPase Era involved in 16S rRNA processing
MSEDNQLFTNEGEGQEGNQRNNQLMSSSFPLDKNQTIDFYDLVIDINAMKSLLMNGWEEVMTEKGKKNYEEKKDKPSVVVSVIGNQNKGKSFMLGQISGEPIPSGYSCKTKGLSVKYPTIEKQNIILLDTAGFETPLVENEVYKLSKTKSQLEEKDYLDQVTDFAKDRQMTEYFLQRFVLTQANILLVLVGQLTYTDQKFLNRIKKECGDKRIFIIHNLKNLEKKDHVEDYIKDTLKLSLTFKLKDNNMIIFEEITKEEKEKHNYIYYTEEFNDDDDDNQPQQDIVHLIMAKDESDAGDYYNKTTIDYIKNQIVTFVGIKKFPIEEKIKEFLFKVSKDIMEEPIDDIDRIVIEGNFIKLSAEDGQEFKLKKCLIDELGMNLFVGTKYKPKYRYFIKTDDEDKKKKMFVIQFAMNGAVQDLRCKVNVSGEYYFFAISGKKNTNTINPKEENSVKLEGLSNREEGYFSFEIKVPNSQILLAEHKVINKNKMYGLVSLEFALLDQQSDEQEVNLKK